MTPAGPAGPATGPARPRVVEVHYAGDLDVADWSRRHAAGEVPDRLPYGLDRMADGGEVTVRSATATGRVPQTARRVVRKLAGGIDWARTTSVPGPADALLAWDERVGLPLAARFGGDRAVVTGLIWGTDAPPGPVALRAARAALRRTRQVFCLSSAQVPRVRELFGVPPDRVTPVAFGVDADFFTPRPDTPGVDRDLLLSVGNDRDRDFGTVLDAFARVRRARPGTRLTIVSRRAPVEAAQAPGVTVVRELDHRALRDLGSTAAATLTLTRPNLHVSGITAALESLALGRPAVVTGTAGMADYSRANEGLLPVAVGDPAAAAAAVLGLLAAPDEADDRGRRGRTAVVDRFSTGQQARRLLELVDAATR